MLTNTWPPFVEPTTVTVPMPVCSRWISLSITLPYTSEYFSFLDHHRSPLHGMLFHCPARSQAIGNPWRLSLIYISASATTTLHNSSRPIQMSKTCHRRRPQMIDWLTSSNRIGPRPNQTVPKSTSDGLLMVVDNKKPQPPYNYGQNVSYRLLSLQERHSVSLQSLASAQPSAETYREIRGWCLDSNLKARSRKTQ